MGSKHQKIKLFIDRALSRSLGRQVAVLAIAFLFCLGLSFLFLSFSCADWKSYCASEDLSPWLLPIYLLIDSNALNSVYIGSGVHGWMLFACSITYLMGLLIFNGMLIGVIVNALEKRVSDHQNGLLNYVKSGHYIIMGYDEMVPSIITDIFSRDPKADVLLLTSMEAGKVHENLRCSVARDKLDQIFISFGHRTVKDNYKDICLEAAKEIFIVGSRRMPAHDAVNVECVDSIRAYLSENGSQRKPERIICVFEDLDTYSSFKTTEIFSQIKQMGIALVPYNFYTGWAHQVFIKRSYIEKCNPTEPISYPSVYGEGLTEGEDKFVHLVFVGMSNFSVAFAMEAAHLFHFPNYQEKEKKNRTRITFIDQNANAEFHQFATRNRHFFEVQPFYYKDLSNDDGTTVKDLDKKDDIKVNLIHPDLRQTDFLDVEFAFVKGDIYSSAVQKLLSIWSKDDRQILSIFVAMADQRKNFMMGMNMPDDVYNHQVRVFIRQDRADDFVTNLRRADDVSTEYCYVEKGQMQSIKRKGRYANIYPFGMDDMAYCFDEQVLRRAQLINYLYCNCTSTGFPPFSTLDNIPLENLLDDAAKSWIQLSVANQWSNLYSAYSLACKMDSLRKTREKSGDTCDELTELEEKEFQMLGRVEHNRWNVEKLLMGFRKARPQEDHYEYQLNPMHDAWKKQFNQSNKKKLYIHHDIRPFDNLDEIKEMDFAFSRYIPWILRNS